MCLLLTNLVRWINMKRFGDLTLDQKVKLFTAWCNDNASTVFSRDGSTWAQCTTASEVS